MKTKEQTHTVTLPNLDKYAKAKRLLKRVYSIRKSKKSTTDIGYENRNGQVVVRATGEEGTDHNQRVYILKCGDCGCEYRANGSDIFERRCPICQGGRKESK